MFVFLNLQLIPIAQLKEHTQKSRDDLNFFLPQIFCTYALFAGAICQQGSTDIHLNKLIPRLLMSSAQSWLAVSCNSSKKRNCMLRTS